MLRIKCAAMAKKWARFCHNERVGTLIRKRSNRLSQFTPNSRLRDEIEIRFEGEQRTMTKIHFSRSQSLKAVAIFIAVASLCAGVMAARWRSTRPATTLQEDEKEKEKRDQRERFLFVWAGDQARTNPDFLAVVNFDESSRDYGKVITTVALTRPGATANEPHHVGLSRDGKVLACGGLLSVLRAQKEIFFFDVSNPKAPRFISAADPPQSAITDEFYPLADGGFLVTMMGGAAGHAPGRVAEFTKDLQLVTEYPADPPMDGFNPHGISVLPEMNLIDTKRGTATSVFDFSTIAKGGWPQLMRMTKDGKRLFISMNMAGKIVMFDTSNPEKPRVLDVLDLGANSGPHYIALTSDESRLVISDYFLNEDDAGKVHAEGDHIVHVAKVTNKDLVLDRRFQLNFNTAFATGPARPHGLAFK